MHYAEFSALIGKTITSIDDLKVGTESVQFSCADGERYSLRYYQDCCASCSIVDIIGDPADLIGVPIALAEEVSSSDKQDGQPEYGDSFTWTFYKLATAKGYVTLRWLGESNGYYSETATFERLTGD